jgi:hypothetical protein
MKKYLTLEEKKAKIDRVKELRASGKSLEQAIKEVGGIKSTHMYWNFSSQVTRENKKNAKRKYFRKPPELLNLGPTTSQQNAYMFVGSPEVLQNILRGLL